MSRPLHGYAAYLFDVDGTLIHPGGPIPGAADALAALRARGKRVLAVTNNSSRDRQAMAEHFRALGLPLQDAEVFSALTATAQLIARECAGARVHLFGNPGLRQAMERERLRPTNAVDADYVVVGNHARVSYEALTGAMRALLRGARFVAVNNDRHYVGRDGGLVPGAGAFVAALERSSGRLTDVVVGKPSSTILCEAAAYAGCTPADCLYIGDNAEVDVAAAHAIGMDALLVLSGVSASAVPGQPIPDHILPSVAALATAAAW